MVGKSTPKGSRSEIAAGSRSRSTEALPPADAQRFPDDQAEEVHIGSSSSAFPTRLFAAGAYPGKLRLNIYSKANVIGEVAGSLKDYPAILQKLLASQFGKLFQLPVVRCHNSAKLIDSLLCRQLVTTRLHELWFTFATTPIRFLLDEYRDVTGLNCGAFDVEDSAGETTTARCGIAF
ncbi:hypothetical protein Bca4012_058193 [Brassica carinata]